MLARVNLRSNIDRDFYVDNGVASYMILNCSQVQFKIAAKTCVKQVPCATWEIKKSNRCFPESPQNVFLFQFILFLFPFATVLYAV